MKHFFSALMIFGALSLAAQPASTDLNWTPTVKFEKTTHEFGNIPEGPKATYEFSFTNTGKEPIMVQNAQAGCGCTTPEWSKAPIPPGKKGKITVGYNSEGRPGSFSKDVTVTFSSGVNNDKTGTTKLTINGNVSGKGGSVQSSPKSTSKSTPVATPIEPTNKTNNKVNSPLPR